MIGRITELRQELTQTKASSTDFPVAKIVTAITGVVGDKGIMRDSVVSAGAIEIVAGLRFAIRSTRGRSDGRHSLALELVLNGGDATLHAQCPWRAMATTVTTAWCGPAQR
jgi:hypothetical protein